MLELNNIYNEDCLQTMQKIQPKSINVILTSPPYNLTPRKGGAGDSGRYDVYKDYLNETEYLKFTEQLFLSFDKILADNGTVLYNFGYGIDNPSLPYKIVNKIVTETPFELVDTICWKKNSGMPFPANKYRLSRNWEFVFVFTKTNMTNSYFIDRQVTKTSQKTGQKYYQLIYNYIEAPNSDSPTHNLNQATFSTSFVLKLLEIYCGKNQIVYDPFMGTGTTAIGCILSDKHPFFLGSELSQNQCNYAKERIEKQKKQLTLF